MIVDIRNEIFSRLKTELSDVAVLIEYPSITPTFPCIVFDEVSNDTHQDTIDTDGEQHNSISFEINIFDNSKTKMSKCREIRNRIDVIMSDEYCMNRSTGRPIPNYMDLDVYRYILRYDFIIDENTMIFRR